MINLREMNFAYLSSLFFIINMVRLPNSDNIYDQLNQQYSQQIENYNISLGDFYQSLLQERAVSLSTINKYFKNNYTKLKKSSKLYKYVFENEFEILLHDGSTLNVTYE